MNYPNCREVKHLLLTGETRIFYCERLFFQKDCGILKYVLENTVTVNNQILPQNTVTYGFYWRNRPYTLYRWFDPQGVRLGDYFNIADHVNLSPSQFEWRDLIVDIFISPQGVINVLDEDELPPDLEGKLARYIHQATGHVLQNFASILSESDRLAGKLF
jgi:hypothetical protein